MCPWNARFASELRALARDLLGLDDDAFRVAFKDSPVKRTKRRGRARNAATVLGNIGMKDDVPLLTAALNDPEPIVREAAGWALGKIGAS